MTLSTVPDYFQEETEEALREQVEWLVREVGVDDAFFGRLLRTDAATFGVWRTSQTLLPAANEQTLRQLWQTTLHLLSFLNFQEVRVPFTVKTSPTAAMGLEVVLRRKMPVPLTFSVLPPGSEAVP
jgi:hypothetical protein